jgi:protein phosphatase inhibitor 2
MCRLFCFTTEVKKVFKEKRKDHYNEYGNVKLARELIEKELAELEEDDETTQV